MNPALYGVFRTVIQGAVAWAFSKFAILAQFTSVPEAVEWVMAVAVLGGYTYASIWLAKRTGDSFWSKLARLVAKAMMLGMVKPPVYPALPQQRPETNPDLLTSDR